MKKRETDTVTIRVHPAVRRWMENTFPKSGGAYDLRGHFLHDFLRAGLTKEPQGRREPSSLPEVKVAVSRRDGQRLGTELPAAFQEDFSRLAYRYIRQTACLMVLFAHKDDELNYAALRKYYQRNWMETEKMVKSECGTLAGRFQPVHSINKFVKNVPFYK